VASIGVLVSCLLLTGGAYLTFLNIDHMFDWVYAQNVVVAFVEEDYTAEQTAALKGKLEGITNVVSAEFLSKDASLNKLQDSLPEQLFEQLQGENNPLLDSYIVTFKDMEKFDATLLQIEKTAGVESHSGDLAETLTRVRRVVLTVSGWVIGVLLLVSLFIISNTIKLTVYSRRLEIYIMKSVGATNSFIRLPFAVEGMTLGLISGGISYGILYLIYSKLASTFRFGPMLGLVSFSHVWAVLLVGFLLAGLLTGTLGSVLSMSKYLRDEGGNNGD
jgi:cell division transport system permease protein